MNHYDNVDLQIMMGEAYERETINVIMGATTVL